VKIGKELTATAKVRCKAAIRDNNEGAAQIMERLLLVHHMIGAFIAGCQ